VNKVDQDSREEEESGYRPPRTSLGGWIVLACITVLFFVFIETSFLKGFKIPSASMSPTLSVGDHILVNRFKFGLYLPGMTKPILEGETPKRGDVVVFYSPKGDGGHYVKRIVGIPGDVVEVRNDRTFVNGYETYEDDYINLSTDENNPEREGQKNVEPVTLHKDQFFVLGDNRANSQDSRVFGPVKRDRIEGKAFIIYWSWRHEGSSWQVHWKRLGRRIK